MRFTVERDTALSLFAKAGKIRQGASSTFVPNLEKIFVEATAEGELVLVTTNLLQILRQHTESVDVVEPGKAVLPKAADLVQFLSACPDGEVTFDVKDTTLFVSAGSASLVRQLVAVNSYPATPDFSVVSSWQSVPVGLFASDLKAVYPLAAAASEPNLSQVVVKDGVFYASSGSVAHVQQASGYKCPDLALAAGCVPLVRSLVLTSENEYVEIGFAKNAVCFRVAGMALVAYSPTHVFPDVVEPLVKAALSNTIVLTVDRDEMLRAARQVWGTVDTFGAVFIEAKKGGYVTLRTKSAIGQTETRVVGDFPNLDKEVVVSAKALVDALGCYPQQVCKIFLGDADNAASVKDIPPVRLTASGGEGGNFVAVMSQLRKDLL